VHRKIVKANEIAAYGAPLEFVFLIIFSEGRVQCVFHTQGSSTLLVYFVFISKEGTLFSRLIIF
jgi:hypothetical protein